MQARYSICNYLGSRKALFFMPAIILTAVSRVLRTKVGKIRKRSLRMLRIRINRYKTSYDFKADPKKPDSFENNWKNNSLDDFILTADDTELFRCRCQSVANYCFGKMKPGDTVPHGDSVAAGDFTVRCFVPPRRFHGQIHAITKTRDIDGQEIDRNAMQTTRGGYQNGRWLIHDRFSFALGADTRFAWSAGCFILSSNDLAAFNRVLKSCGVKAGDEIQGTLIEV